MGNTVASQHKTSTEWAQEVHVMIKQQTADQSNICESRYTLRRAVLDYDWITRLPLCISSITFDGRLLASKTGSEPDVLKLKISKGCFQDLNFIIYLPH
jgi:hypothetical protein